MKVLDDSHGSGTVVHLLLDGSVAAKEAADESRDTGANMVDAFKELCIVGVETNESNFGLEANMNKL